MRIEETIRFDQDEQVDLKFVSESCHEARNFFTDEGIGAVRVITHGGHPVSYNHLLQAWSAMSVAMVRLDGSAAHRCLPAELKQRYHDNLMAGSEKLKTWMLSMQK